MKETFDFCEYDSPGAKKFIETALHHFGGRIPDSAILGVLRNLKDDDLLNALSLYIEMDEKNELQIDRMMEVVVYLMYYSYRRANPKAEDQLETMYNGEDPDDYWGSEDYGLRQLFP